MAALNFPDHNLVTSYTNPDTGITYEWTNNSWKAVRTSQVSSGSGSQTLVSDTMPAPAGYEVGTLWWNSDSTDTSLYVLYQDPIGPNGDPGGKYWIEAAPAPDSIGFNGTHTGDSTFTGNMSVTGSATFAGQVTAGGDTVIETGSLNVYQSSNSSTTTVFNGGWNAGSGRNITSTIYSDGSATFANYITSGVGDPGIPNIGYININGPSGQIYISKSTSAAVQIFDSNNNRNAILLNGDGSATFADIVKSDHSIEVYNRSVTTGKGGAVIGLAGKDTASERGFMTLYANTLAEPSFRIMTAANDTDSKTVKVGFYNDGSATFAGEVTAGDFYNTSGAGSLVSASGAVFARQPSAAGVLFQGLLGNTSTSSIRADGNATFAGEVVAGVRDSQGVFMTSGGALEGFNGGSRKYSLSSDGSATFQSYLNVNNYAMFNRIVNDGYANYFIAAFTDSGGNKAYIKGNGIFIGNGLTDANGVTPGNTAIALRTDGSATFNGTVTENASDRKFKENIVDAPSQLTDVSALQLRTWDWNDLAPGNEDRNDRRSMGLVAQEAELIDSNLVYDVNEGEDTYKAVDYKVLTMKLLGAVKELSAKVAALEAN